MTEKIWKICFAVLLLICILFAFTAVSFLRNTENTVQDTETSGYQKPYLDFLEKVYTEMDKNYYKPVSEAVYRNFVRTYKKKYLAKIKNRKNRIARIAHLGAGLLVNDLKDPEDTFTNFIPPKKADEYAKKIYGYEHGIGIEGHLVKGVYLIDHVQIRSEAFKKGIRARNVLLWINGLNIKDMTEEQIKALLHPPIGTEIRLRIALIEERTTVPYTITCTEYFKETVREIPTDIPGVCYLKISTFNKETANDIKTYLKDHNPDNIEFLILDVMGNPGGPPLAVCETAGIFLPPGQKLVYYKKKNTPRFGLTSPSSEVRYNGRLIVLIDKKSGSASELLAGTLKAHRRAVIMGKESTAGFAFLKGAARFEDGSMLAMVTGIAYLFNGIPFGKDGVEPAFKIPQDVMDIQKFVLSQIKK